MATQGPGPWEGQPYNREIDDMDERIDNMSALEFTVMMAIAIPVLFVKGVTNTGRRIYRHISGNDHRDESDS